VLIYVGSLIESMLGRWNYLLLYISTGIIASMVSVIWHDHGVSAGASGAIFGLFGILLALLSTDFYERSARRALLISTAIFVGYNILPVGGGVDHAAHFGGLISGYVFGWLAYFGLKNKNKAVQQWGILISCVTVVMVFVSCSVLFTPKYQLKEFEKLVEQSHTMTTGINHSFYNYNLTAGQKLDSIETNALPELKKLGKLSQKFEALVLPTKLKREAGYRAKIITLECDFFNLLYLEFKNHDRGKYRPAIEADTKEINNLRIEWGKEDSGV
jgi:rhomboid protease GluP